MNTLVWEYLDNYINGEPLSLLSYGDSLAEDAKFGNPTPWIDRVAEPIKCMYNNDQLVTKEAGRSGAHSRTLSGNSWGNYVVVNGFRTMLDNNGDEITNKIMTLNAGHNDSRFDTITLAEYYGNMNVMIDKAYDNDIGVIIMGMTPRDIENLEARGEKRIKLFSDVLQQIAVERNIPYVDMEAGLTKFYNNELLGNEVSSPDQVHHTEVGSQLVADILFRDFFALDLITLNKDTTFLPATTQVITQETAAATTVQNYGAKNTHVRVHADEVVYALIFNEVAGAKLAIHGRIARTTQPLQVLNTSVDNDVVQTNCFTNNKLPLSTQITDQKVFYRTPLKAGLNKIKLETGTRPIDISGFSLH